MDHSRSRAHIRHLLARRAETHGCCGEFAQSCDRGSIRSARRGLDNGADRRRRTGGETSAMVAAPQGVVVVEKRRVDAGDKQSRVVVPTLPFRLNTTVRSRGAPPRPPPASAQQQALGVLRPDDSFVAT